MTHPSRKWSARDLDAIKRMFLSDGATYLQIAEAMGSTRGAIAGLCGRKLWRRPQERKIGLRKRSIGTMMVRVTPLPMDTAGKCQWIEGDASSRQFCGEPGYPWCADHHKACYIPARSRA